MARHQVRRLPVVDRGKVVGIIAQADIATRLNAPADTAALVEEISREWKDM
ncbi:CBS domain protein [compost metagenome]